MFKKIEFYIQNIQRENWGFPWHVFFANILFMLFFPIVLFTKLNFGRGIPWALIISWGAVNLIGLINEMIKKDKRRGFWQDVIGNNIGILIAFIEWIIILQII